MSKHHTGFVLVASAVLALTLGLFAQLLYISIRFEFRYALGAIEALVRPIASSPGTSGPNEDNAFERTLLGAASDGCLLWTLETAYASAWTPAPREPPEAGEVAGRLSAAAPHPTRGKMKAAASSAVVQRFVQNRKNGRAHV
jgi:hypothetical protein